MPEDHHGPYALSHVLREEFEAIRSGRGPSPETFDRLRNAGLVDPDDVVDESLRRNLVYRAAHDMNLSALCLSGGGIRSASFSLGVIQGLAEAELLSRFEYISTVSGGGYIGSWLSAWLYWTRRNGGTPAEVLQELRPQRKSSDEEPHPIRHLREYSSYLTPKVGLLSGDFWAAFAIVLRNLLLNWLILVPLIALPVILVKIIAAIIQTAQFTASCWAVVLAVGVFCLGLAAWSLGYKLRRLYLVRDAERRPDEQRSFLKWGLIPAILAGFFYSWMANQFRTPAAIFAPALQSNWGGASAMRGWLPMVAVALIIYAIISVVVRRQTAGQERSIPNWKDWLAWTVSAIAWGLLIWLGVYLYSKLAYQMARPDRLCPAYLSECTVGSLSSIDRHQLLIIFGMPWFLLCGLLTQSIYCLAHSYSPSGDFEREWLGRAAGWYLVAGLGWIVVSVVVLLGPEMSDYLFANSREWLTAIAGASGAVTAFLGRSSLTSAQGANTGWRNLASNIVLGLVGPIFALVLLILFSKAFDGIAFEQAFHQSPLFSGNGSGADYCSNWTWSIGLLAMLLIIMFGADLLMNVNRFSLHAVYRNRLVRAYLGGPRLHRKPDGLTGFDQHDNFRVADLRSQQRPGNGDWCPFHVINMTLNLPSTRNLAWQQRKAMSFAVTPLFSGTADLGFRRTGEYGNPDGGISLGTAMAISGAAASPNMGYHSSPSVTFLLTLFNVRLGWWLGNPGRAGDQESARVRSLKQRLCSLDRNVAPYAQDSPWLSVRPLLSELFGLMNEEDPYVYLSDGGHFEDLGIYEMVRRRCKWIVAIDGDADPERGFVDLGDAVRKVWIDLGVRISFENSDLLQATRESKPENVPYFALGKIEYVSDQPIGGKVPCGQILYIKPTVRGDEWAADVIAYQRANPDFPHQSTGDQWFDEPQLEAYRALGYLIIRRVLKAVRPRRGEPPNNLSDLFSRLAEINAKTLA